MPCSGHKKSFFEHCNALRCLGTIVLQSLTGHSTEFSLTFIALFKSLTPNMAHKYLANGYFRICHQTSGIVLPLACAHLIGKNNSG